MFYKINSNVMFRNYLNYGYITDNSLFGYRLLNQNEKKIGEKYVSESGAIFLSVLNKEPQDVNLVIEKLCGIFVGVTKTDLEKDAIDFYNQFVSLGFLSSGATKEECNLKQEIIGEEISELINSSSCSSEELIQENILRGIHIEIANICNERCVHCYIPHKLKTKEIDSSLFYKIIEEARKLNVINITLSGGEPLFHKDICNFLKRCRELDLSVNILSNLTLLNDEIFSEIIRNPLISVQVSLYSINPSIHDSITNLKGSCEKTKNSIKRLVSHGIPVQIACPIMKQNKAYYKDVLEWGKENSIPVVLDYMIFAEYDHSGMNIKNRLSDIEICNILDEQFSTNKKYLMDIKEKADETKNLTPKSCVCSICKYYLCVSSDGDTFPCAGWQNYKFGNLKDTSISEIWENSKKVKTLRGIKRERFEKCMQCEDKDFCTICMMKNYNEDQDEDMFKPNQANCKLSSILHKKVMQYIKE